MSSFASIRQAACELRTTLGSSYADSVDGRSLVDAVMRLRELELGFRPRGDLTLNGALAVFNRRFQIIFCVDDIPRELATYYIAHEIGHAVLHSELGICGERDMDAYGQGVGGGAVQKVEAYGAKERKEAQSNVFARELLLPRYLARKLFIERAMGSRAIAAELGLPLEIVRQQLADALLLPEISGLPQIEPKRERILDPSQEAAAKHMGSALLLEAGPGTGKTGTLVARVLYLLEQEVDPSSILVLTFSNKAAAEFRERIEQAVSGKAAQIWAGTFHAFGLELLRKHHDALGLPSDLRLLDNSDALDLAEEELATLPDAYLDLWEPARELKHVLKAISRAKDELVGPEQYRALAQAMIDAASCDEDREAGAKSLSQ
jgi:DNA helicase II / ATP-dependent DNA helicase PcrA